MAPYSLIVHMTAWQICSTLVQNLTKIKPDLMVEQNVFKSTAPTCFDKLGRLGQYGDMLCWTIPLLPQRQICLQQPSPPLAAAAPFALHLWLLVPSIVSCSRLVFLPKAF